MFKRAATELLALKQDDAQSVLLATVRGKNEDIVEALRLFPYFGGWSEKSVKECCIMSTIKRFLADIVMLNSSDMDDSHTYFIIDGTCTVVQKVAPQIGTRFNGKKVSATRSESTDPSGGCSAEKSTVVFVTIRRLVSGDCFGLGEELTDRWVLSETAVRCLVIPRDFLLRHDQNNIWPRVRRRMNSTFPPTSQVFSSLVQQVQWSRFKRDYIEHLRQRKNVNKSARLGDVPCHWRINADIPSSLL